MRSSVGADISKFRATMVRLHGEQRAESAYRRALLHCANEVLRAAVKRREWAARLFLLAWQEEDERAWLVVTRRRPPWLASTWRAQAYLAETTATELEWSDLVEDLMFFAGEAVNATRPVRAVVIYDDEGNPHSHFARVDNENQ